ncbi:MAG TPA: 50S ribosomal protein L13 [Planctomycetia bacterium]|nr:50S ribosomal protein L13 [Planctomycetia bacterium]
MKTFVAKEHLVPKTWYVVNAEGKVLGRMAARIATILQGKHKPQYTPHVDTGYFVIVVNAHVATCPFPEWHRSFYRRSTPWNNRSALIDDPQASFAASTTFLKSITVVTGPTPPGTGGM